MVESVQDIQKIEILFPSGPTVSVLSASKKTQVLN